MPDQNLLDLDESLRPKGPTLQAMHLQLSPLREAFNQHRGQERLLALVSPSCNTCASLLKAVRDAWLLDSPERAAILVFQRVYPADNAALVRDHLRQFPADRVTALMDEQRLAASWMTQRCLPLGVGRHLVLVFSAGAEWADSDPVPVAWCHAMRGMRAGQRIEAGELALWLEGLGSDLGQGRR